MKNSLKISMALGVLAFLGSTVHAQAYVDDLYYDKNNASHRKTTKVKPKQVISPDIGNAVYTADIPEDYYPGMFTEAVSGTGIVNEYGRLEEPAEVLYYDWKPGWYAANVYINTAYPPSWYMDYGYTYLTFNPWFRYTYFGDYWGNPWTAGISYYAWYDMRYLGWDRWWAWHGYPYGYPFHNPYYYWGWGGYYPPYHSKYNRDNTVRTASRRSFGNSYTPGRATAGGSRSGIGAYRPNTGTTVRYNNTTLNRTNTSTNNFNNSVTYQYNRATNTQNSTYNRGNSNTGVNNTGGGGGGGTTRTYNRRR